MSAGQKIPATIVTGFLGAGKTTLLRNLLRNAGDKRIALIVNEFGDMGFDGSLVDGCTDADCAADEVVELTNGCICCTVADDFLPTMEMLINRNPAPDHILIETSGLALPQPLVRAFNWPSVKTRVSVDAVVTVVDSAAVAAGRVAADEAAVAAQRAADDALDHESPVEELFEDQLICADLVVLNKLDLIDADAAAGVRDRVGEMIRPRVEIVSAEGGVLPLSVLLGRACASEDDLGGREAHHDHHHDNDDHGHDHHHDDFESWVIAVSPFSSLEEIKEKVSLAMAQKGVLRIKGVGLVRNRDSLAVVQAVGPRVETWFAREARSPGNLVVIGLKGFDVEAVRKLLGDEAGA